MKKSKLAKNIANMLHRAGTIVLKNPYEGKSNLMVVHRICNAIFGDNKTIKIRGSSNMSDQELYSVLENIMKKKRIDLLFIHDGDYCIHVSQY